LETLKKQKQPRPNSPKDQLATYAVIQRLAQQLNQGISARNVSLNDEEKKLIKPLNLLTIKPVVYAFNVSDKQLENKTETENKIKKITKDYILLNAKLENEVLAFSESDQKEYLKNYQLEDTGLNRLIKKSYEVLGLISFLTAGTLEARAWTITQGMLAPQAAGVIHTDFEKKFIKAEIVPYQDFVSCGGWLKAREIGKVQIVGKDYVMRDGDVVEFKIGA
jgi:ribosome-binding ATPase YchF (GTP1/OBG family)